MRLASFCRVDRRGGAETYVVDLCRSLVEAGHAVDLYAESWRPGVIPSGVRCVQVEATGRSRREQILSFGRNSELALQQASHDCTVGMINTWHHDVIIPQGGVSQASVVANAKRFPAAWQRALYRIGKAANPKSWTVRAIEHRQYNPDRKAHVVAVSNMVLEHLVRYQRAPAADLIPNAIDVERWRRLSRRRAARSEPLGLALRPRRALRRHNFSVQGLKPASITGPPPAVQPEGRPLHLLVCEAARSPRTEDWWIDGTS